MASVAYARGVLTEREQIGSYRVLRPIATGGTAEVYEVQDPASGERLALKQLVAPALLDRFDREFEAMTRLNHPSVVRVYHYGFSGDDHLPWMTMELVRGLPAVAAIKRAGRPGSDERTHEVLRVGYHVARALQYVHDRQLVHRDLKSANVLVLPDDRVKLIDFGAAALLDPATGLTTDNEFIGTVDYASPEQIACRPMGARSDLYSLGVLLFRLATGKRPFDSDDPEQLARMHQYEPPPNPRAEAPGLSEPLAELIVSLLQKSPSSRPASAEAVAHRLEELRGRPFSMRSRLAIHEGSAAIRHVEHRKVWAHLTEAWLAMAGGAKGRPAMVLVDGDDGSDRVRFLDEVKAEATERGIWSHHVSLANGRPLQRLIEAFRLFAEASRVVTASPGSGPPMGGRGWVPDVVELHNGSDASGVPALPVSDVPVDRTQLRAQILDAVHARTSDAPVLILVSELHFADVTTVELLSVIRRAAVEQHLALHLVCSVQTSALGGSPLGGEIERRFGDGLRLSLAPLSQRDVAVAVGHLLGRRPPPAELARRLHAATAGQPLYVEDAVADLVQQGTVEADGNRLAWADSSMDLAAPKSSVAAAEQLLVGLPLVFRRVLEVMVVGEEFDDPALIARAFSWAPDELPDVLQRLVSAGILRFKGRHSTRVEWRYPIVAQVVDKRLHPCRRALLARLIADAARTMPPSRAGVRAMVLAGRIPEAARVAVALAQDLVAKGQVRTALSVLAPVVEKVTENYRNAELSELFLLHSQCLRTIAPTDPGSVKSLARAKAIADLHRDPVVGTRVMLAEARRYFAIGHYDNTIKGLRTAWDGRPGNVANVASNIAVDLATSFRLAGDLGKADHWAVEASTMADLAREPVLAAAAASEVSAVALARGRLLDAEATASRALAIAEQIGNRALQFTALARWGAALRQQAKYSTVLHRLYTALPEAAQWENPKPYIELLLVTAWIELDLSRLGRAQECVDELAATISRGEHLHLRLEAQLLTGRMFLASGQLASALYPLQEVQRLARQANLPVLTEQARAAYAEFLAATGDKNAAQTTFNAAILGLTGAGDQVALAEGVRARARAQGAELDTDQIFRPVSRLLEQEPMPMLRVEFLLARATWLRAQGERDQARQRLDEARTLLASVAGALDETDQAALRVHPWAAALHPKRAARAGGVVPESGQP